MDIGQVKHCPSYLQQTGMTGKMDSMIDRYIACGVGLYTEWFPTKARLLTVLGILYDISIAHLQFSCKERQVQDGEATFS